MKCTRRLREGCYQLRVNNGSAKGNVYIPHTNIIVMDMPFHFTKLLLPIRLVFTITINEDH